MRHCAFVSGFFLFPGDVGCGLLISAGVLCDIHDYTTADLPVLPQMAIWVDTNFYLINNIIMDILACLWMRFSTRLSSTNVSCTLRSRILGSQSMCTLRFGSFSKTLIPNYTSINSIWAFQLFHTFTLANTQYSCGFLSLVFTLANLVYVLVLSRYGLNLHFPDY